MFMSIKTPDPNAVREIVATHASQLVFFILVVVVLGDGVGMLGG